MEDRDFPTSPYSEGEKQQIGRDLHESLQLARREHDQARTFYLEEILDEQHD